MTSCRLKRIKTLVSIFCWDKILPVNETFYLNIFFFLSFFLSFFYLFVPFFLFFLSKLVRIQLRKSPLLALSLRVESLSRLAITSPCQARGASRYTNILVKLIVKPILGTSSNKPFLRAVSFHMHRIHCLRCPL